MELFDVSQIFSHHWRGHWNWVVYLLVNGVGRLIVDISSVLVQNEAIVYIVGRRKENLETAVKLHQSVSSQVGAVYGR
jgi:hypothetical protein